MSSQPVRIVIVGGGTAGWMTAAALGRFLERGYTVTLVESEQIGTVGVGEATIPQIRVFNNALGIDEDAFLRATSGTIKLGIEFVDWLRPGHRYMHAFGSVGRDLGLAGFQHYWRRADALGKARPLGAYALNEVAARAGRMRRGPAQTSRTLPEMPYAFHFDASLYAAFLRRYAEAHRVRRVEGRIIDVALAGETGEVASVTLEGDRVLAGDVFIDCSGFRGLLIEQALKTGYEDWSRWLPCDRALAVPCGSAQGLTPYTRATARAAGWQWRIPLQHRTGNGYVYASAHLSDDEAARTLLAHLDGPALADPRPLRFVAGKRKRIWNRNVVAIGLASGFLEPLESTSIHLVQSAISRLLKLMPGRRMIPAQALEFNRQSDFEYERIRDFIILHYKATARDDSAFWRERRDGPIPDTLAGKIELFREGGHVFREHEELFTEAGWMQVLIGQGVLPAAWHPLADQVPQVELAEYLSLIEGLITREVASMPRHEDFIALLGAGATVL
jgi:tryptophan halogenase